MDISKISITVSGKGGKKELEEIMAILEEIPLRIFGALQARLTDDKVLIIESEGGIKEIYNDIEKGEILLRSMHIIIDAYPTLKLSLRYKDIYFNIISPLR